MHGPPALRRAHLDQVVAALWPAARRPAARTRPRSRSATHLSRRARRPGRRASLPAWDAALARHGVEHARPPARSSPCASGSPPSPRSSASRARSSSPTGRARRAATADELAAELAERTDSDLERGFTGDGPHRDDLVLLRDDRELRAYGSQGEQRLALLALLLAEREVLAGERDGAPLLLLDDVMSELDAPRRARLVDVLRASGQTVVTATELAHVPGADEPDVVRVAIAEGRVLQAARGAGRR